MERDGRQEHETDDEARPEAADSAAYDPRLHGPDDEAAEDRAHDAAPAAADRGPADEHGGERDQQQACALGRKEIFVFQGQYNARQGAEHAHQREQLDPFPVDFDADHACHVGVVTDEQQVLTEAVAVQDEPHQHGQPDGPEELNRHRADPARQDIVDDVVLDAADVVAQPARGDDRRALPDKEGRKCRDDRGYADAHHEETVQESDQAAHEDRREEGAPYQKIMLVGHVFIEREDTELGDHHEYQAGNLQNGGEGEVDFAGGDDKSETQAENERWHDRAGERRVNAIAEKALGC